jgi:hypothetical protein
MGGQVDSPDIAALATLSPPSGKEGFLILLFSFPLYTVGE